MIKYKPLMKKELDITDLTSLKVGMLIHVTDINIYGFINEKHEFQPIKKDTDYIRYNSIKEG